MLSASNIFDAVAKQLKGFYLLLQLSVMFEQVKLCIIRKKFVMTDSTWKKCADALTFASHRRTALSRQSSLGLSHEPRGWYRSTASRVTTTRLTSEYTLSYQSGRQASRFLPGVVLQQLLR